ncbi:hypothetical protein JT358_15150 [Micrococcales bacterium 31B]|nr:hypothetical protein [Micrococcales bacterium 31B]
MTRQLQRSIAAFASLSLILGAATACASNSAPTNSAANTPTSTVGTPKQTAEGSTASGTPTPSGGGSSASVSTPATPQLAVTTEDPQYIGTPAPGSTWTPPTLTAAQVAANQDLRSGGLEASYQDPAVIQEIPTREPLKPNVDKSMFTRDDIGAIKVSAFYFDALDYALLGGDPTLLRGVSQSDFSLTNLFVEQQEAWKADKAIVKSSEIYVENLEIQARSNDKMELVGDVHYPSTFVYYPDQSLLIKTPDKSGRWRISLIWGSYNYWIVTEAAQITSEHQ